MNPQIIYKFPNECPQSFFNMNNGSNFNQIHIENNKKKITRNKFTTEEDEELIRLVSIYGKENWKKISEEMSKKDQYSNSKKYDRTARQCKERYINYLSPEINNNEWSAEEDQLLMLNSTLSFSHWKEMKKLLPGRSEIAIRNRFNYLHRKYMSFLKPNIEHNISTINLSQKNGLIEINGSPQLIQNSDKTNSEKKNLLDNFNLKLNPSYMDYVKSSILNVCNSNKQQKILNPTMQQMQIVNKKTKMTENATVPQQWVEAAKTIIEASHTDEAQDSIQKLKNKVKSLNVILENRALFAAQNNFSNLFSNPSEFESFDDPSTFDMFY